MRTYYCIDVTVVLVCKCTHLQAGYMCCPRGSVGYSSRRALFCIFMFGQHICDVIYTAHSCRNADKLGCGAPVTRTGCWTQDKSPLVNTAVFTVELLNLNIVPTPSGRPCLPLSCHCRPKTFRHKNEPHTNLPSGIVIHPQGLYARSAWLVILPNSVAYCQPRSSSPRERFL